MPTLLGHSRSVASGEGLANRFEAYVLSDLQALKSRYDPKLFLGMVYQYGGVGASKRLLADPRHTSYGFEKLWEIGELERSVEFAVCLSWFSPLSRTAKSPRPRIVCCSTTSL